MWMSLAPSFAACVSSALSMRMIGASFGGLEQVLDRRQLLHHARQVDRALDLADHRRGARLAAGIGGGDALRERRRRPRARSASTSYRRSTSDSAGSGDRLGRPQHQLLAVVFEQQRVRLGEGVGQRMAGAHGDGLARVAVGAGRRPSAGAGGSGRPSAAAAAPCRRAGAARRWPARRPQRRQHRRLVDRQDRRSAAAACPAAGRGSSRSGRARAVRAVAASRITTGRRNTIRLVRLARAVLAAEQAAEERDVAEQRHLRCVVGVAVLDQAAEHHDLAVVDDHRGLDRALVGGRAGVGGAGRRGAGDRRTTPGRSSCAPCRLRRSAA